MAGLWRIVADLGRTHLQPVRPQPLNTPDLLQDASVYLLHQFDALLFIHLSRLLLVQLVDYGIAEAAPVFRSTGDKFVQQLIRVAHRLRTVGIDHQLEVPVYPGLTVGGALLHLMLGLYPDLLPRRDDVYRQINIR